MEKKVWVESLIFSRWTLTSGRALADYNAIKRISKADDEILTGSGVFFYNAPGRVWGKHKESFFMQVFCRGVMVNRKRWY